VSTVKNQSGTPKISRISSINCALKCQSHQCCQPYLVKHLHHESRGFFDIGILDYVVVRLDVGTRVSFGSSIRTQDHDGAANRCDVTFEREVRIGEDFAAESYVDGAESRREVAHVTPERVLRAALLSIQVPLVIQLSLTRKNRFERNTLRGSASWVKNGFQM
jgi:hypothetical protein